MDTSDRDPPLPGRREDLWAGGTLYTPPVPMRCVGAGGGMVVAAGEAMHVKRPGSHGMRTCLLGPAAKPFHAVAVEPWSPRRFAVASDEGVTVFACPVDRDPVVEVTLNDLEADVTHLAWGRVGREVTLYFLCRTGSVACYRPATRAIVGLDLPRMVALTADVTGRIALLQCTDEDTTVYTLEDGTSFVPRVDGDLFIDPDEPGTPVERVALAMAGDAVAYGIAPWGLEDAGAARVSWAADEDFVTPRALSGGALCFEDGETLLGAYSLDDAAVIVRETRAGRVTRVMHVPARAPSVSAIEPLPIIASLAWDATRRWVFGASPTLGFFGSEQPLPPGTKKPAEA